MILIYSISSDQTTSNVIEWLVAYGNNVERINEMNFEQDAIFLSSENMQHIEIESTWYRKFNYLVPDLSGSIDTSYYDLVKSHISSELSDANTSYCLCRQVNSGKILGDFKTVSPLKYEALLYAKKNGLNIPHTVITNKRSDLIDLFDKYDALITKCINDGEIFKINNVHWGMYTSVLTRELVSRLPERFFPTLIQEKIEKVYEIRIFYLDGICYSMAIFSQNDDQTKTDFRRYNSKHPNRNIPYKLPANIENRVISLMIDLKYNTGSIDLIKAKDGRYIFLEINPVGQFGMVSYPCNYNLEKKVADWLNN